MESRITKLQEFLRQQPGDCFLRHALAMEYIGAGETEQARRLLEEILADDPGYVASYYQLGKLYESAGEVEKALDIYEKGIQAAQSADDRRARNELQSAYDELAY